MANSTTFLDDVLQKTNLIELINDATKLEKRGRNYVGLCPFHDEKTPSFSVSEEKQVYHCFSCKASGNALTFVKETKGLSHQEAVKFLAQRIGLEVPTTGQENRKAPFYALNHEAMTFFKVMLNHTEEGHEAKRYLTDRGVSEDVIQTFDLGYAPKQKDALFQTFKSQGHLLSDMVDVALVHPGDQPYDFYRQRLIFPLHDTYGNVIGFSGRTIQASPQAKYINSPTTVTFEKNQVLYNFHRAKKVIKDAGRVVVFEGFMDVIAAHQAGLHEGVAIMGTALTPSHLKALKPLCQVVYLCLDSDQAGQEATRRFIETVEQHQLNVRIVQLPQGMDPDDYIQKHGREAFLKQVEQALSKLDFLFQDALKRYDVTRIDGLETVKSLFFKPLAKTPLTTQRHYLERLAKEAGIQAAILIQDFERAFRFTPPLQAKPLSPVLITDKFQRAERLFLNYFFKNELYTRMFRLEFDDLTYVAKEARDIQFEIFEYYDHYPQSCIVPSLFIQTLPIHQQDYLKKHLQLEDYPFSAEEFEDLLTTMHQYKKKQYIDSLKRAIKESDNETERKAMREIIIKLRKEQFHGKK